MYICTNFLSMIPINVVPKHEFNYHQFPCVTVQAETKDLGKEIGKKSADLSYVQEDMQRITGSPLLLAPC